VLHFENARLITELHDKIASLDVEKALRERFVSTLAHDLRGPLAAARLGAELLVTGSPSADERSSLAGRIDRNIGRSRSSYPSTRDPHAGSSVTSGLRRASGCVVIGVRLHGTWRALLRGHVAVARAGR
jgi:signal transduction histidine kinase